MIKAKTVGEREKFFFSSLPLPLLSLNPHKKNQKNQTPNI